MTIEIYTWLPKNHSVGIVKRNSGHAAIRILGNYFSFTQDQNNNVWNTHLEVDESYHKKVGNQQNKSILNIDSKLYPYLLDIFRSLKDSNYDLLTNNCSDVVARFILTATMPYIIKLFGHPMDESFWLKQDNKQSALKRYKILKKYYPSDVELNVFNSVLVHKDEEAILVYWTLFDLYYHSLLDQHGILMAKEILKRKINQTSGSGDILWHPYRVHIYAKFLSNLVNSFSDNTIEVPKTYTISWESDGLIVKRTDVEPVEKFTEYFNSFVQNQQSFR